MDRLARRLVERLGGRLGGRPTRSSWVPTAGGTPGRPTHAEPPGDSNGQEAQSRDTAPEEIAALRRVLAEELGRLAARQGVGAAADREQVGP